MMIHQKIKCSLHGHEYVRIDENNFIKLLKCRFCDHLLMVQKDKLLKDVQLYK